MRFTPAGDSGRLAKALADAFGSSGEQRSSLVEVFTQIKQGYEAGREGRKSNNLAAAMTFFIAANVVAYDQTEMPFDADTGQSCLSRCNRLC